MNISLLFILRSIDFTFAFEQYPILRYLQNLTLVLVPMLGSKKRVLMKLRV